MTSTELGAGVRPLPAHLQTTVPALATACLCLLAFLEYSGAFGVLNTWSPVSVFVATLALCGGVALLRLAWAPTAVPWEPALATVGYLAVEVVLSATSALSPAAAGVAVSETLKLLAYVAVISVLAADLRAWHQVALAIVVPMAVLSLLAMANQFVLGNSQSFGGFATVTDYLGVGVTTARHAGPLPDPNFWGRLLVIGLPFGLALLWRAWSAGHRRDSFAAAVACASITGGIYLTGSRGTFLAAAVAVAVYCVCVGVRMARLLVGMLAGTLLLLVPGVGSRLLAMRSSAGDESVEARLATQRVAWTMIQERPFTGVGPGGFSDAFGEYAARGEVVIDRVLAPHDLYLALWAEVGLFGLAAFSGILLVGLVLAGRSVWVIRSVPSADAERIGPYAAALLAGLTAWCVASVFLHLSYARAMLLLIVLSAVMWRQVRLLPRVGSMAPPVTTVHRAVGAVVGAALGATAAVAGAALVPQDSTATRTGVLTPVQTDGALGTYLASLRTRSGIGPGYSTVIDTVSPSPVEVRSSAHQGTVIVTATGVTAAAATAKVNAAVRSGDAALRRVGMDRVFTLSWRPDVSVAKRDRVGALPGGPGAAGALLGAGIGLGAVSVRERHQRRRHDDDV